MNKKYHTLKPASTVASVAGCKRYVCCEDRLIVIIMGRVLPGGGGLNDGRQPPAQSNVKILENWVENRI